LKIVIYNPGAQRIFGYSQSEVLYKMTVTELFPAEITDPFRAAQTGDATIKDFVWRETEITARDGQLIPVKFSGSILRENGSDMRRTN